MRSVRGISLRPVTSTDLPFLYQLMCDPDHFHLWGHRRVCDDNQFVESWRFWSAEKMAAKFIVTYHDKAVGLLFDYERCLDDGHTKVAVMLDPTEVGSGKGVIALALFCNWLFKAIPLRKIYVEVFEFNEAVVRMLGKLDAPIEMRLKEHRYWHGKYWDQLGYAFDEDYAAQVFRRVLREPAPRSVQKSPDDAPNQCTNTAYDAALLSLVADRN